MTAYKKIIFLRSNFDSLRLEEKILFLQCWHIVHQIAVLEKSILASDRLFKTTKGNEQTAQVCQFLFFVKQLAGVLYEAWEAIRKGFYGTQLARQYTPSLKSTTQDRLKSLKRYFSKPNSVSNIRNQFSFHSDMERVASSVNLLSGGGDFEVIVPDPGGFHFCGLAEHMINDAMLKTIHADTEEALRVLYREVLCDVATGISEFCHEFCCEIVARHNPQSENEVIHHECLIDELRFPYFVNLSRAAE